MIGTERPKNGKPRERVLSDAELAAIWKACGDDDYGKIVRLLILTGCRRHEIGGMCWSEIDREARHVDVACGAEQKQNRAHAAAVADDVEHHRERAAHGEPRSAIWSARRRVSAAGNGARLRSMRASIWRLGPCTTSAEPCATRMADLGVMPHIIEQILNHQSGHKGGIAGIYNRSSYEREVRTALATWHDHVRSIVDGGKRKIITMPRVSA